MSFYTARKCKAGGGAGGDKGKGGKAKLIFPFSLFHRDRQSGGEREGGDGGLTDY